MKEVNLLIWITQLGVSVAAPPAGFTLLGLWLRSRFGLGFWVMPVCIGIGMIGAISGLCNSLKLMDRMERTSTRRGERAKPPVGFNDHE